MCGKIRNYLEVSNSETGKKILRDLSEERDRYVLTSNVTSNYTTRFHEAVNSGDDPSILKDEDPAFINLNSKSSYDTNYEIACQSFTFQLGNCQSS